MQRKRLATAATGSQQACAFLRQMAESRLLPAPREYQWGRRARTEASRGKVRQFNSGAAPPPKPPDAGGRDAPANAHTA